MLTKALTLLAMAGVVGGFFTMLLTQRRNFALPAALPRYVLLSIALGALMIPLFLLMQVGGINQSGVRGMFDAVIANIVWHSGIGAAAQLRLLGLTLAAPACWLMTSTTAVRRRGGNALTLVSILLIGGSFALTGHVATLSPAVRVLLVLHVLMAFLWIGALYPLLQLSRALPLPPVAILMQDFGRFAVAIVMLLLLAGMFLALMLLRAPGVLSTPYGHTLLLKLAVVCVLLLLAARNNMALVPRLETRATLPLLQNAIRAEMAVALFIVTITTWLTTVTGPGGM